MRECCECKGAITDLEVGGHKLPPQDLTQNGDESLVVLPLCRPCVRWLERVRNVDDPKVVRANGSAYYLGLDSPTTPREWKGHAGATFLIEYKDGRPAKVTSDLWHQGEIPAHFRDRLPDNATVTEIGGQS